MATIEGNLHVWDKEYVWTEDGDEWSGAWGTPEGQWSTSVYPRMKQFVPAARILELAPGRGRWTQYLKDLCEHLTVVELPPSCIEHCKERFKDETHIDYFTNDGKSLPEEVPDGSIDFIFCYDSFVHCEIDVMAAYVKAIQPKLREGGVAFIHHSNLGEYGSYFGRLAKLKRGRRFLERRGVIDPTHFRAPSVTAEKIRDLVHEAGMTCISQECFPWIGNKRLIDAITIFENKKKPEGFETPVLRNASHELEAVAAKARCRHYPVRTV